MKNLATLPFRLETVSTGALDVPGETDLTGQRVLVIENDYYLATDVAHALRNAGAEVLGPLATEEAGLDGLQAVGLTGAVVDINLGSGPSFAFARELKSLGIPFVFMTGYDEEIIPAELAEVPLLQKPVDPVQVINLLAKIVDPL